MSGSILAIKVVILTGGSGQNNNGFLFFSGLTKEFLDYRITCPFTFYEIETQKLENCTMTFALSSQTITYEQLAKTIDHSLLRPELTEADVIAGCELAARYHVASV
jgi:hypothetical protein